LAQRHVGVFQQLTCNFEANLVGDLPERQSFHAQVTAHGATVHGEQLGNHGGGT